MSRRVRDKLLQKKDVWILAALLLREKSGKKVTRLMMEKMLYNYSINDLKLKRQCIRLFGMGKDKNWSYYNNNSKYYVDQHFTYFTHNFFLYHR